MIIGFIIPQTVKNSVMYRYSDTFFLLLGIFIVSFILCGLLTANVAIKLVVAFCTAIASVLVIARMSHSKKNRTPDYRSFVTYCILSEEDDVAKLFEKTGFITSTEISDGFYPSKDGVACLYLKFSKPSKDYIVTLYKKCLKNNVKHLTVWCADYERTGVGIACTLPGVEIKFRTLRPLYKKIKKSDILSDSDVKPVQRTPLKTLLPMIFSTRNSYRFALVSFVLYAMSLLTPLRTYYIVTASIVLFLAVIARIYGERSDSSV